MADTGCLEVWLLTPESLTVPLLEMQNHRFEGGSWLELGPGSPAGEAELGAGPGLTTSRL